MSQSILRNDYQPYPYQIPYLHLQFFLNFNQTKVCSRFTVYTKKPSTTLVLDGEELTLVSIRVDGMTLSADQYQLTDTHLHLSLTNTEHLIEIESICEPEKNTTLMGLYQSGRQLFTQCEAEGFRRITWFADRPDVLSRYTVELIGDKTQFPYLLSNGNLISQSDLDNNQHKAVWEDPFAKPSYLFAVVAGDFDCREEKIKTASGREVLLQLISDKGDYDKTEWAMQSLISSLRWDEQRFGLELDLDRYMVVSAADFNMGAMENKGLNVFNAAYVLAQPESTTDQSYRDIEAVIGHEYFHNWTGNRVTCRDWFQLSLKEGLTVFRDQEFSADMMAMGLEGHAAKSARAVKRIDDVSVLRVAQFPEDAGPMAHPIRPNSYEEISNFYTATIYEKGAEVIRMFHTLLGESGFQAALNNYFARFDGQAITCDDFKQIMDEQYQKQNPGLNLEAFSGWYEQAGTPTVTITLHYDAKQQQATLFFKQENPAVGVELLAPTTDKKPLLIPFKIGFLNQAGQTQKVCLHQDRNHEFMLRIDQAEQQVVFNDVQSTPVLSLLRDFSAPIIVNYDRPTSELVTLAKYDDNAFSRWQAIQELASQTIFSLANANAEANEDALIEVWGQLIQDRTLSAAYLSRALNLPSVRQLLSQQRPMDPLSIQAAHQHLEQALAERFSAQWLTLYHDHQPTANATYSPDALSAGVRALKNLALKQAAIAKHPEALRIAAQQYAQATNMTDQWGALTVLVHYADAELREHYLTAFYDQWQHNALVIDRWFSVQATAPYFDVEQALQLQQHPDFNLRNPNRARALIFQFCTNNITAIHTESGYDFWRDQVLALDALNPEISARLCRAFDNWSQFVEPQRSQLQVRLQSIAQHPKLSANVTEIIHKALTIE